MLAELEAFLLHHDHRADPSRLEALLAPDLTEINAQGLRVDRGDIMRWLMSKPQDARWVFGEMEGRSLGEGHMMLHYVARQVAGGGSGQPGHHVSVWRWLDRGKGVDSEEGERGGWQLLFHQATRIDNPA